MPKLTGVVKNTASKAPASTNGSATMTTATAKPDLEDLLHRLSAATGQTTTLPPAAATATPAPAPAPAAPVVPGQGVRDLTIGLLDKANELYAFKVAVLIRGHMLLLGSPGTAKSLFASQLFGQLPGVQFHTQLNKVDTGESVFGVPNVKALREEGRFEYGTDGTILGANWAFLDEIFDASDMLMRRLLGVLNERKLALGPFAVDVPLHSAIATANYSRENEVTSAVLDRFVVKVTAKPVDNSRLIQWALKGGVSHWTPARISDKALTRDLAAVDNVKLPAEVGALLGEVNTNLNLTNRTALVTIKMVQAAAFLQGRNVATPEDVEVVRLTKIDESGDIAAMINQAVAKIANERNETELLKRLEDHYAQVMSMQHGIDAIRDIRQMLSGLANASFSDARRAGKRDQMVQELNKRRNDIAKSFGFID